MHSGMESRRFSVIVAHRRFGKTVAVINHLIKQALLCKRQDPRYGYVGPYRNQAEQIAWLYLKRFTSVIPGVQANESRLEVRLPNKAAIRIYGADNPDSLRGLYFDGVVLDEVADMRAEIWDEIIPPTIADRSGWVVFIGTPRGINFFYKVYQQALGDSANWYAEMFSVDDTDALPQEEIELQRKTLPPNKFKQEFQCDFTADVENAVIPLNLIEAAYGKVLHPEAWRNSPLVFGVDVARFGDDRSVIAIRQGLAVIELIKRQGMDVKQFADLVAWYIDAKDPDAVLIDDIGVGAGVVDILKGASYPVTGINSGSKPMDESKFLNRRAEMWWRMREWLEAGGVIPADPQLREEMAAPMYLYDPANRIRIEKKEDLKERIRVSPDLADALALTFSSHVHKKAQFVRQSSGRAKTDYDVMNFGMTQ